MSGGLARRRSAAGVDGPSQWESFRRSCAATGTGDLTSDEALHRWSVDHFREFWSTFLTWAELAWEGSAEVVCTSDDVADAEFFPDVRLNYAENLLRPLPSTSDASTALTSVHADGTVEHLTRAELRERTRDTASALAAQGVRVGDRVVLIAVNDSRTTIAALAAMALGATVSTAMPDMGPAALLDRFGQVAPAVLVIERAGPGWTGSAGDTLSTLLDGLPSLRRVLVLDDAPLPGPLPVGVARLATDGTGASREPASWPRLPFNHPLLVLFTSGTTGPPKALVHGAGGTLLEHLKEHRLHGDLRAGETLHFHTTTAWMMWNWQLSALAVGARIVLDARPVAGPETLWELVSEQRVNVFGTSPAYLQLCQDEGYRPADQVDLGALRSVLSTGSALHDWQFDWVADAVGPQPLQSISGGTDVIGCFVLGHPERSVVAGRCQSLSLGLDVVALDPDGRPVLDAVGELVCRRPFPSRPLGLLADPGGQRFRRAYFSQHPGVWTHGDLIEIAADGSSRVHGRSDGVLNVDGIRIGPAEVQAVLRGLPQLAQCLAVEQQDPGQPGRTRMVLLVVLRPGHVLDADLSRLIRHTLRREASPAHVPSAVLAVDALPTTHNGKLSERAARDVLNGVPVANASSLRNPGSLAAIAAAAQAAVAFQESTDDGDDDVITVVRRAFESVLGTAIADDAHFFDAGGTSRQSMRLLRRLRLELEQPLRMSTFLARPTVAGLAAALAADAQDDAPIELIRAGDAAEPPLFLVHGSLGDVDIYWATVEHLDLAAPVLGLSAQFQTPSGWSRPPIAELARRHVQTITSVQPEGPVRLAGFSFGGLVAFEVARQLVAGGRTVEFLGLVDVHPPAAPLPPVSRFLNRAAVRLSYHVPGMYPNSIRTVLVRLRTHRARPSGTGTGTGTGTGGGSARKVFDEYQWGPYPGPVSYFRARRRLPVIMNQLYQWRRVAPRMTVVSVPGAHYYLLHRENAIVLGARMSEALRAAGAAAA